MTTVEFTNRVNLAEAAAIKIVQIYLPAASPEDILSWRRRLDISTPVGPVPDVGEYPELDSECCVHLTYWINHNKQQTVIIQISLCRNSDDNWEIDSGDHDIDWLNRQDGCRRPFVTLDYLHGEFFESQHYCVEINPFTLA